MNAEPYTRKELADIISAANADLLVTLGLSSGEISFNKARKIYGRWFTDAVEKRRIVPVRIGRGSNGAHVYSIKDILLIRSEDYARAAIQNH